MKMPVQMQRLRQKLEQYKYVALILCAGLLLMLLPTGARAKEAAAEAVPEQGDSAEFDLEELEGKLEQALSQIEGVGETTVVLTLRSGAERVLAQDTSQGSSVDQETVIVSTGSGTEEAVSVKTIYPEFQGALVVCEGGASASVKLEVLKAVSAMTGLSSDQISICQRK